MFRRWLLRRVMRRAFAIVERDPHLESMADMVLHPHLRSRQKDPTEDTE